MGEPLAWRNSVFPNSFQAGEEEEGLGVRDGLRYPEPQHEAESGATIPESEIQMLELGKPEELGAGSSTYLE